MQFLIYKTHLPQIESAYHIILKNSFSDFERELSFDVFELFNAFKIEVRDINLSAIAGQNTLLVLDENGDTIYRESAFIIE